MRTAIATGTRADVVTFVRPGAESPRSGQQTDPVCVMNEPERIDHSMQARVDEIVGVMTVGRPPMRRG